MQASLEWTNQKQKNKTMHFVSSTHLRIPQARLASAQSCQPGWRSCRGRCWQRGRRGRRQESPVDQRGLCDTSDWTPKPGPMLAMMQSWCSRQGQRHRLHNPGLTRGSWPSLDTRAAECCVTAHMTCALAISTSMDFSIDGLVHVGSARWRRGDPPPVSAWGWAWWHLSWERPGHRSRPVEERKWIELVLKTWHTFQNLLLKPHSGFKINTTGMITSKQHDHFCGSLITEAERDSRQNQSIVCYMCII